MVKVKKQIQALLEQSLATLQSNGTIPSVTEAVIKIENSRNAEHGDFASNIAMTLAKAAKINPRQLAQSIIEHLPVSSLLEQVEIAGPGFINFYLKKNTHQAIGC